jgi:hypothetical protein
MVGWLGLVAMSRPDTLVRLIDHSAIDQNAAFQVGLWVAFAAFAGLAIRWTVRMVRTLRRVSWDPELRAVQGTVMAEFALVLPIVLLLMGTVIQIALIAHAAIVVRYAAFAAARSAMVSFEADVYSDLTNGIFPSSIPPPIMQLPPFPEWVDPGRPEQAAHLVLASISPRAGIDAPRGASMENYLAANGGYWGGGNYAERVAYAQQATDLKTIRLKHGGGTFWNWDAYWDSVPGLIPLPEHAVQPARQRLAGNSDGAYLLPAPPPLASLIPSSIPVPIPNVPTPAGLPSLPIPGLSGGTINIPIPTDMVQVATQPLDDATNWLRNGTGEAIRWFARSPMNNDIFAPKEVEITLEFQFKLAVPSLLQLAPGVTDPAPVGTGRVFLLKHSDFFTVRLQSTGGRRSNLFSLFPIIPNMYNRFGGGEETQPQQQTGNQSGQQPQQPQGPDMTVPNTFLYWRSRDDA